MKLKVRQWVGEVYDDCTIVAQLFQIFVIPKVRLSKVIHNWFVISKIRYS